MDIGRAIKTCRVAKGLKLEDVAKQSKLQVSYLSGIETGKRKNITLSTLKRVSDAIEVPLNILIFTADDKDDLGFTAEQKKEMNSICFDLISRSSGRPLGVVSE